jgi:hypothetical protein
MKAAKRKPGRPTPGDRSRLNEIQAKREELRLQRDLNELLPTKDVERVWKGVILGLREKIGQLDLPLNKKAEILKELAELPVEKYL